MRLCPVILVPGLFPVGPVPHRMNHHSFALVGHRIKFPANMHRHRGISDELHGESHSKDQAARVGQQLKDVHLAAPFGIFLIMSYCAMGKNTLSFFYHVPKNYSRVLLPLLSCFSTPQRSVLPLLCARTFTLPGLYLK